MLIAHPIGCAVLRAISGCIRLLFLAKQPHQPAYGHSLSSREVVLGERERGHFEREKEYSVLFVGTNLLLQLVFEDSRNCSYGIFVLTSKKTRFYVVLFHSPLACT